MIWDTGIPAPPSTNTPPAGRLQKSEFLRPDGAVVDVCDGAPCVP